MRSSCCLNARFQAADPGPTGVSVPGSLTSNMSHVPMRSTAYDGSNRSTIGRHMCSHLQSPAYALLNDSVPWMRRQPGDQISPKCVFARSMPRARLCATESPTNNTLVSGFGPYLSATIASAVVAPSVVVMTATTSTVATAGIATRHWVRAQRAATDRHLHEVVEHDRDCERDRRSGSEKSGQPVSPTRSAFNTTSTGQCHRYRP